MTHEEMRRAACTVSGALGMEQGITVLVALEIAAKVWNSELAQYYCLDFVDTHLKALKSDLDRLQLIV